MLGPVRRPDSPRGGGFREQECAGGSGGSAVAELRRRSGRILESLTKLEVLNLSDNEFESLENMQVMSLSVCRDCEPLPQPQTLTLLMRSC